MALLSWISDDDLDSAFDCLIESAVNSKKESVERMQKNVIDPFSSLVIASVFDIKTSDSLKSTQEGFASISGLHNAVGLFHQNILASVKGWVNHDTGYDIENKDRRIIAEIKNKHNTLNSSAKERAISDLDIAMKQKGRDWNAYLVIIIPKKPTRYKTKLTSRNVFEIDGTSFYDLVTGKSNSLKELFDIMCDKLEEKHNAVSESVKKYCDEVFDQAFLDK